MADPDLSRDAHVRAVLVRLQEFVTADVESLFDMATAAVDSLIDATLIFTTDRFDEDCHDCEQPIRDHLVDGRCPTVVADIRGLPSLWFVSPNRGVPERKAFDHDWVPEQPDAFRRVQTCWAAKCERPAAWELICRPNGGVVSHEHYCEGHSLERGRRLGGTMEHTDEGGDA